MKVAGGEASVVKTRKSIGLHKKRIGALAFGAVRLLYSGYCPHPSNHRDGEIHPPSGCRALYMTIRHMARRRVKFRGNGRRFLHADRPGVRTWVPLFALSLRSGVSSRVLEARVF